MYKRQADYRDYTQGDDLRRLDWNVFARLERPFIKLTEEQEDLAVHLLVDTSASMNWPPDEDGAAENKLLYSLRLAGALGTIALTSGDLVQVTLFDAAAQSNWGPFRGRANGWPLLQFLEAHYAARTRDGQANRATVLDLALRRYAQRARRPGLLFLLSDLFSPGDVRDGLTALLARGYEVVVLHGLTPDEPAPKLAGLLRRQPNHPGSDNLQAVGFKTGVNLADDVLGDGVGFDDGESAFDGCLLYTSPSPRDRTRSRMPSSA